MKRPAGITLGQVFALGGVGLAALLALLFLVVLERSRSSSLRAGERLRGEAAREIEARVGDFLGQASEAVAVFEAALQHGLFDAGDPLELEAALYRGLLGGPDLAELTLTYGRLAGHDPGGRARIEPGGRGQVSVYRAADRGAGIATRWTRVGADGRVEAELRDRSAAIGTTQRVLAYL